MKITTRLFEIEVSVRARLFYARVGKLDACYAYGQGFTFGNFASWL